MSKIISITTFIREGTEELESEVIGYGPDRIAEVVDRVPNTEHYEKEIEVWLGKPISRFTVRFNEVDGTVVIDLFGEE